MFHVVAVLSGRVQTLPCVSLALKRLVIIVAWLIHIHKKNKLKKNHLRGFRIKSQTEDRQHAPSLIIDMIPTSVNRTRNSITLDFVQGKILPAGTTRL